MEEQAFRQAVEDHRDVVFRIALTYLRDRADADDVAQDVFLKLLKSDAQFESWEHLRRWLIRVTINECKSLFRKPWRRVEDIENLAESLSTAQDETKAVLSDVMRLPERFRIPIVLYYYLGFSTSEIAELLHVPAATVRTRLARGRSKLKGSPTPSSIPAILPLPGETTATGIPLPGPTAAHRELNIPTPESLAMASRPKAWKAQSRRLICPSRATAIRLISMRWQSTKTAAEP